MKAVYVAPGLPAVPLDTDFPIIKKELGTVSFAYPFDDSVALAHDDNGIQNHRKPNRTIGTQIVPGPFYILGMTFSGELTDLTPEQEARYLSLFAIPESFPEGHWKVFTRTRETPHTMVVEFHSEWEAE